MSQTPNTQRGGLHAYTLVIAAGKTTKRTIRGTTIRVADAAAPINVTARASKLNDQRGNAYTLTMKKFEKWFLDTEYDEVLVENPTASAMIVTLQLGYGDYEAEILSRTVAAPAFTCTHTLGVLAVEGVTVSIGMVTVPENLQRKKAKAQVWIKSMTGVQFPAAAPDVYAVLSHVVTEPTGLLIAPFTFIAKDGAIEVPVFAAGVGGIWIGEFEIESTAAFHIGVVPAVDGGLGGGDDYTLTFSVRVYEEAYTAS